MAYIKNCIIIFSLALNIVLLGPVLLGHWPMPPLPWMVEHGRTMVNFMSPVLADVKKLHSVQIADMLTAKNNLVGSLRKIPFDHANFKEAARAFEEKKYALESVVQTKVRDRILQLNDKERKDLATMLEKIKPPLLMLSK